MKGFKVLFIVFVMLGMACSATKNNIALINSLVLTIENEEAISYLEEKYKSRGLSFIKKLENSDDLYIWSFEGLRSNLIPLKKQLINETSIIEVSNYIHQN